MDVTNWDQIAQLIQTELLSDSAHVANEDEIVNGKMKYFALDKVIGMYSNVTPLVAFIEFFICHVDLFYY